MWLIPLGSGGKNRHMFGGLGRERKRERKIIWKVCVCVCVCVFEFVCLFGVLLIDAVHNKNQVADKDACTIKRTYANTHTHTHTHTQVVVSVVWWGVWC